MRRTIPPELRRSIVLAYRNMSALAVSDLFGVHETTVLKIVREAGETVRVPAKRLVQNAIAPPEVPC